MKNFANFRFPAIIFLLLALIFSPTLVTGYRDSARAESLAAREPAQAAALYESAARRLVWRGDLLQKAGELALAGGDQTAAIRLFEKADSRHALTPQSRFLFGEAYFLQGKLAEALAQWEAAQQAGLESGPLYNRLGRAYTALARYDEAIAAFEHARQLDSGDVSSRYWLGLVLATRRPQEALAPLLEAAQIDPKLDPVIQGLRQSLNTALLAHTQAGQLTGAGRALLAIGETTLAAEALHQAQNADPGYASAYAWMGAVREAQNENGLPDLQKAIELDPRNVDAYILLGTYWQKQGDRQQSLAAFEKAVQIEPQNPAWQVTLASAQASGGDLETAASHYQHATELAPDDPQYWRLLADFCVDYSYSLSEVGLPAALQAYLLSPESADTLVTLGRVNYAIGEYETARKLWLKALEKSPDNPAVLLNLGVYYLQTGDIAQAGNYLSRVVALDPGGAYGTQASSIIERYLK